MIDKSRGCDKCVHAPICTLKKQREKEINDLEYRASMPSTHDFVYAVDCAHFMQRYGKTNITVPQRGDPAL